MTELRNPSPASRVGVLDAIGMGWSLMFSDFWMLWVLGIVFFAVNLGVGIFGCLLCCLLPLVPFFVGSPLNAGLFRAVRRRIDGGTVQVADLFAGFQPSLYWQIVIAGLPVAGVDMISQVVQLSARLVINLAQPMVKERFLTGDIALGVIVLAVLGGLFLALVLAVVRLFFTFALLAIWDQPMTGGDALKVSMRLAWDHFWPLVGLVLLFALLGMAAVVAGALACCVGLFITVPAVTVWEHIALIYVYRAWRGQPLVQPQTAPPPLPAV